LKKHGGLTKRVSKALHDSESIDLVSLLILTLVDAVSINIFLLSIAVDILTACQFTALGIVAVLFKVRARMRRKNAAWFFWALITFFGGIMFTMNTVIIQGDDTKPTYVLRAESSYQAASDAVDDLLEQQAKLRSENRRSVAIEMEPSILAARTNEEQKQKDAEAAELRWKTEPGKKIRAIDIFARIPYIFKNPSAAIFIASGFFIVLFVSVESSIFVIAGEIGKDSVIVPKKKRQPVVNEDRFEDVTDEEYRVTAELPDGSVRLPEDVAILLHVKREEAERIHIRLYPDFVYRNDRYVRIGGKE